MADVRLLLVDDEDFFRESVGKELALTGYAVESAGSLGEARRLLKRETFHVVVLDMRLPDGNGLTCSRRSRRPRPPRRSSCSPPTARSKRPRGR